MYKRQRRLTNAWASPREYYQDSTYFDSKLPFVYEPSIQELNNDMTYEMLHNFVSYNENRNLIIVDENKKIINVSDGWTRNCGYTYDEVYDQSFRLLQGTDTCLETIKMFEEELKTENKANMNIINYSKSGLPMQCHVDCIELQDTRGSYFENPKFLCEMIIL